MNPDWIHVICNTVIVLSALGIPVVGFLYLRDLPTKPESETD